MWSHIRTACLGAVALVAVLPANAGAVGDIDITQASLEQLLAIDITGVSRKAESVARAPAAVFVLTADDIRRAGVTNIPDALRLVPGVNVAKVDSSRWAVSVRGFNARSAQKLLVLIDGRAVYNQLFSGVFWEVQDAQDIDRIEVIRGPGASVWGANAVNGIINIVTKSAADTHGLLGWVRAGSEEKRYLGARAGTRSGRTDWRIYGKSFERDAGARVTGPSHDDWHMDRAGFRTDSDLEGDTLTVQGEAYEGVTGTSLGVGGAAFFGVPSEDITLSGANILSRWTRPLEGKDEVSVQAYFDYTNYDSRILAEKRRNFDIEASHRWGWAETQDLVWGVRARHTEDDIRTTPLLAVVPSSRGDDLFSAFFNNETSFLEDQIRLQLGAKFEHNSYTGFEVQPSARLSWQPITDHTFWAAVSRAVRVPSRLEDDLVVPGVFGRSRDMQAEELLAWEAGWRAQLKPGLNTDVAVFYNQYDALLTNELTHFGNKGKGETWGAEVSANWLPVPWWRLDLAYGWLHMDLRAEPGALTPGIFIAQENADPRHTLSLRSRMDLSETWQLDGTVRYVDALLGPGVPDYMTADLRLAWKPRPDLELSLVGRDLLDPEHPEQAGGTVTEVQRSFYGQLVWRPQAE